MRDALNATGRPILVRYKLKATSWVLNYYCGSSPCVTGARGRPGDGRSPLATRGAQLTVDSTNSRRNFYPNTRPLTFPSLSLSLSVSFCVCVCMCLLSCKDVQPDWNSLLRCLDNNIGLSAFAGPGGFNDFDMLEGIQHNSFGTHSGVQGNERERERENNPTHSQSHAHTK